MRTLFILFTSLLLTQHAFGQQKQEKGQERGPAIKAPAAAPQPRARPQAAPIAPHVPKPQAPARAPSAPAAAPARGPAHMPEGHPQAVSPEAFGRTPAMSHAESRAHLRQNLEALTSKHAAPPAEGKGVAPTNMREQVKQQFQRAIPGIDRESFRQKMKNLVVARKGASPQVASHSTEVKKTRTSFAQNFPNHRQWFNDSFFSGHNFSPHFHHHGDNWWRGSRWITINNFIDGGWAYPIYYDVTGIAIPIQSYSEQNVYYTGEAPPPPEAGAEWIPLGIFAASQSLEQSSYTNYFVQMAIDKEGDLAGSYYNAATDQLHPLEGYVDKELQQAIWKVSDSPDSPIMTTGIYDLTQDVAYVQVHFTDGTEQTWVFVRVNE